MQLVLLSGGSGKRLFPLSNEARSKQFVRILPSESGTPQSMLQRVWGQLEDSDIDNVYICAGRSHFDSILNQVGDVPVILEPQAMDTFPAIALSTLYLRDVVGIRDDEVITTMPIDPYVDEGFFTAIKYLEHVSNDSASDMVLLGVKPTSPSSQYGYIVPGDAINDYYVVEKFHEKPSRDQAEGLITDGALWNCGVFSFRIGYLIKMLERRGYPTTYQDMVKTFSQLPKISFDYEVVEQADSIVVFPYEGEWKDLGTWDVLSDELQSELLGNGTTSGCTNTHVINQLDVPVIANNLDGIIVVASADGILVSDKSSSGEIKSLTKNVKSRPMYEERRWGNYTILNHHTLPNGDEVLVKRISLHSGKNLSYHKHFHRKEVVIVTCGTGLCANEGRMTRIKAGDVLEIVPGSWHAIKAIDDLEFIEVQEGSELIEEDIVRQSISWDEIESSLSALQI